jgi:hypothetical protein
MNGKDYVAKRFYEIGNGADTVTLIENTENLELEVM